MDAPRIRESGEDRRALSGDVDLDGEARHTAI
jgi:hypothetical protein